ncbi:MAG: hypothetical protein HOI23_02915 [Deltaproteobacteria bacterium]|nr:hypothetical protein [Deltaproteobacteria bacterium]
MTSKKYDPDKSENSLFTTPIDRRTAIKSMAAMAATPAMIGCGETEQEPVVVGTPETAIEHVVVLMLENRSFDHYLGSLSLVEGRTDIEGLTADMSNPDPEGGVVNVYHEEGPCFRDPPHGWTASRNQFNGGLNDGFVNQFYRGPGDTDYKKVMGYFIREQLPIAYAMADQYAVANHWYSSVMGPTWPNRFFSHAAQNGGYKNNQIDGDYSFQTLYHRLYDKDISFACYYNNISFMMLLQDLPGRGRMNPFEEFHEDAMAGKLPSFSVVEPMYGKNCDHPPVHPMAGQLLISSVIDSLAQSPKWDKTMLVITYDEHGGYFDHVAPPKAEDERAADGFDQMGFRVPTQFVGPYVKEKFASNTIYDHASILAFAERLWNLEPLNVRDSSANDFFDVLDMDRIERVDPRPPPSLPVIVADEATFDAEPCGTYTALNESITGQRELEDFINTVPFADNYDRREQTQELYDSFLESTQSRGLWRKP